MALPRSNFPADFEQSVERPHCLIHENNGQELWLSEHSLNPQKSTSHVLNIQPFAPDFQIEVAGHAAIPVTIAGYQKAQRYRVARWLSDRRYADGNGNTSPVIEFLQHRLCPEIFEDRHFSIIRPLGHKGRGMELDRCIADYNRDGDGLILPHNGEAMTDEQLAALFPESEAIRVALFDVIRLPNIRPVYSERIYQATFGTEKKMITEKTERTEVPKGPLTPEMREILEKYGKIVYERIAPDADRVLICFKHFHGFQGDHILHWLNDRKDSGILRSHQSGITAAHEDIMKTVDIDKVIFYEESATRSFEKGTDEEKEARRKMATALTILSDKKIRMELCTRLSQALHISADFIQRVLFGFDHPENSIVRFCMTSDRMHQLHGDGRVERWQELLERYDTLDEQIGSLHQHHGQAGVATDIANLYKQSDEVVMAIPQKGMVAEISTSLTTGAIGLMTYGGAHFKNGNTTEDSIINETFENYFPYLLHTQIVVVEENHYKMVLDTYEDLHEQIRDADPATQSNYVLQENIRGLSASAQQIVSEYCTATDQSRQFLWANLQKCIRGIHALSQILLKRMTTPTATID